MLRFLPSMMKSPTQRSIISRAEVDYESYGLENEGAIFVDDDPASSTDEEDSETSADEVTQNVHTLRTMLPGMFVVTDNETVLTYEAVDLTDKCEQKKRLGRVLSLRLKARKSFRKLKDLSIITEE